MAEEKKGGTAAVLEEPQAEAARPPSVMPKRYVPWPEGSDKPRLWIGMGTCGTAAGAEALREAIEAWLKAHEIEAEIHPTGCVGMCHNEPLVDIQVKGRARVSYKKVSSKNLEAILKEHLVDGVPSKRNVFGQLVNPDADEAAYEGLPDFHAEPFFQHQVKIVMQRCGVIDYQSLDDYLATGGYQGLKKAVTMSTDQIIEELKKSGLRGRGGAGFPTWMKWKFARDAEGDPKYIVCNADEGDPGAFMDRAVLEGDPHTMIEGMIIGGYAIGARHGYIYCRAEYPLAIKILNNALAQCREHGYLGENILGTGYALDITIKEGAGAYVCGEEMALLNSIMGERGMPVIKPPFPATRGVWGKPTNINNVETLSNVAEIVKNGGDWYAYWGSATTKGTKTFALTGKVKRPGLIEVPAGTTIRRLVDEIGGGMSLKKVGFKAAQFGGPSGGCLPAEYMDTGIDYESLTTGGAIMGSGGVVVLDEYNCMVDTARFFMEFTVDESCGKCTPCRDGTALMLQILERITHGEGRLEDIAKLDQISGFTKANSLCGLGQVAPNPVLTTIRYFRDEMEEHIVDKKCRAHSCDELIEYVVMEDKCTTCGLCKPPCPTDALEWEKKQFAFVNHETCIRCKACVMACPFMAIK
jgi:NADH-quinone oxidoreductase subunit F